MRCRQSARSVRRTEPSFAVISQRSVGQVAPAVVHVLACVLLVGGVAVLGWTSRVALQHEAHTATLAHSPVVQVKSAVAGVPVEEPVVSQRPTVQLPRYPASLNLVNDEAGHLLSCSGTIGHLDAAKALNLRVDVAYPNNQTECHFVVDAAYGTEVLAASQLASLIAALQQQKDAMLAINGVLFAPVAAHPALQSHIVVDAATADDARRLRDRVQQWVGNAAQVQTLQPVHAATVVAQRLQATKQLMATLPASGVRPADIMRVLNTQVLDFAPHQSVLPVANQVVLTQAGRWLKQHPQLIVDVRGFTDGVGNGAYNMALGQQRADAVRAFWLAQGVARHQVRTSGMGGTQPIASNVNAQGQFYNRRIEFWAYNGSDVHLQAAPRADVAVGADD
jgi:OOP family OmpA-OmpF porin